MKEFYKNEVVPKLKQEFGLKNIHAVPNIRCIILNVGLGSGLKDARFLETVEKTFIRISGQRPVKTKARKSISTFKIRAGMVVGMKVTLRGKRMWDFLEKLFRVSLPRVRDFRGLPTRSLDGQGNLSVGVTEQLAFPEIQADQTDIIFGVEATFVTSARDNAQAESMFRALGFPLSDEVEEALPVARRAARVAKKEARATK